MNRISKILSRINLKTLYFNFKYFPFKDAIKMPVFLSKNVHLKECSGRVLIHTPVYPGIIKIGYGDVGIFDKKRSRFVWQVNGEIVFKGKAHIGHGSKISVNNGARLEIGENFMITAESSIVSHKEIQIGNNCLLSWDILVMDTDFHKIIDSTSGEIINEPTPVIIGDNVWIGCRSTILKGSKIGNNSIIGANSLVNKDISEYQGLLAGVPVKPLKKDVEWAL